MSAQSFDAAQHKVERHQWWDSAAAGWNKWWPTIEQGGQHISNRLVELAEIRPGHRVLDIATGIGEPAVTAAHRVGSTGHVVATDQSPQMIALAQERAAALPLQNLEFREMDAEALDFPESSFDAVLCQYGLMFLSDVATALSRIRRLLVPNANFAVAVWGAPAKVPMRSLATIVIQEILQLPPPPPRTPAPLRLSVPGVLEQAFIQADFTDVRTEQMTLIAEYPSVEAYINMSRDLSVSLSALLDPLSPEQQAEVREAITEAVEQYAVADGGLRMPNETILVVGRR